jgi:hypothetical protein
MPGVRQVAQKAHAGAYAAPIANLDQAEQAARDVAARRQADNQAHAAWVLGQQGKLAAIGQANDQRAAAATAGVQAGTLHGNQQLMGGMQAARQAQGIQGPVPSQQLAGLSDDAARQNLILGAATQRGVDRANTNAGKAGFVSAAALANMNAQSRAIAGDEFQQVQGIRREKTGLLADEANATMQQRAAETAAKADIAKAEIAAAARDADRSSRENIANAQIDARRMEGETDREFQARQNRANRRVRLKTAATTAAASGYVAPAEQKRRNTTVLHTEQARNKAVGLLRDYKAAAKASGHSYTVEDAKYDIEQDLKGAPQAVVDYALAAAFGHKAGVTAKGGKSAAARYYEYVNRIKRGEIAG